MFDQPPVAVALSPDRPSGPTTADSVEQVLPETQRADGTLVIDLLPLAPQPQDCGESEPDPFNPEIIVCRRATPSPRLGPQIGPEDDGFASAIPRARLKLSDKAAAEANATNPSVGGWNARGGEVRLKIDF